MLRSFQTKVTRPILSAIDILDRIQSSQGQEPPAEEARTSLKRSLGPFDVGGEDEPLHELARRALIYWMDEVLIYANWQHARPWSDDTLERELLGTRNRATRFYAEADIARGLERLDAFEMFALCSALGA